MTEHDCSYKETKLLAVPEITKSSCSCCFFENKGTCDGNGIDDRNGITCMSIAYRPIGERIIFIEAKE